MEIGYTVAQTSLGKVLVGATERGVSAVYLGDSEAQLVQELKDEYPRAELAPADHSFERWVKEIVHRVEGKPPRRLRGGDWACCRHGGAGRLDGFGGE